VIILILFVCASARSERKRTRLRPFLLQYFFYFNRIVGIFVSFILRLLLWKSHNAYFEIGGISFSFLGGEIIFNDVRYISRNQSLRIARGEPTEAGLARP